MPPLEHPDRVDKLWEIIDTRRQGSVDFNGLKKGLRRMDHPLKNADSMLQQVFKTVDMNGDGRIQYGEFRDFVSRADEALWELFKSIDRNQNGEIDRAELRYAFSSAGITVSSPVLDEFLAQMDRNNDGVITYNEWRDFLLFLPTEDHDLRTVLSYYKATGNLNPEGDVDIGDSRQGLGIGFPTQSHFLLHALETALYYTLQLPLSIILNAAPVNLVAVAYAETPNAEQPASADLVVFDRDGVDLDYDELEWLSVSKPIAMWLSVRSYELQLTDIFPHLGYFIAGGLAGAVSRTATAPLDRLKVYLIAQTGVRKEAVRAAQKGAPVNAVRKGIKSLVDAMKELWKAGGVRSLFAGNGLNVVKIMPESAIKFGAYEASKRAFARLEGHNDTKKIKPTSQFLSGGLGGMVAQCFVYPIDTLKFRMQCEVVQGGVRGNKLIAETARKMWQTTGGFAFFRGLPLGLMGMFPYAAIDLSTFEYLKRRLVARKARQEKCHEDDVPLSNFTTGAIGAFSGALGASFVYPLNVLRTRLQAQGTVLHPATYDGIIDVTRTTYRTEGIRGFYKGITPNMLKVAPAVSISYIVYENAKRFLGLK
ncbi:calcium dependent mitochondrial carrier protein, putative [Talaromyces stipitatus ATCC 10500]|uniref:Mitochondrial thiamine pyrophosphate carrier 1 n=1 Tax=Talaromyces stipitatus (strain ATCC 10500 / CBS 375.48 / QM 6759 / NRRL 1006) TaxID=441959 RepID=B8MQ50_TALSN|nr:calcium dependent mitochondrial carrier protein, putative [Talaromyces stipitatus ATCC 10500]EED13076.1 calcium dependent mitochondrial carrier protein, putative [Talaromyces stipitatus ATCC 10500]